MASSTGKCIRFNEKAVRALGRETIGVRSIKLGEGEYIVDMSVVKPDNKMLTISEFGYGKRTDEDEYRVQGRNGKGIKAGIFNEQTGGLVNLKQVCESDDIMLIDDEGQIIRVKAKEISTIGRNTKGVRIMRMKEGRKIVCVAVAPSEEEEESLAENLPEQSVNPNNNIKENEMPLDEFQNAPVSGDDGQENLDDL